MPKRQLETLLYSTAGVVLMLVVLVAFNFVTGAFRTRVDMTQEKAYTLSKGTREILRKLDTPVRLRFYCSQSESATPETVYLRNHARRVEDLLAEYKQIGGKNILVEKFDPQPLSDAEDAARMDGIEPQPLPGVERFYLGIAVSLADERRSLPFLAPNRERLLEYDLSRAISQVVKPEKATIGILSPLPVFGAPSNPMMMQMGQRGSEPWALVTELKNDYTVKRVGMDVDKIDDDIKVLVVIHPKDISDKAQYAIDQFVLRGGKLLAFFDAAALSDNRQQQNPMFGNMGGGGSSLPKLLKAWGYEFDTAKAVADMNLKLQIRGANGQPQEAPAWLALTPDNINKDDVAASDIDSIWMPLSGAFQGVASTGLTETVLLKSTANAQLVDAFLANLGGDSIIKEFKPSGVNYKLGIRLTGTFHTAFPDGPPKSGDTNAPAPAGEPLKVSKEPTTVVLIGDSDLIFDPFTVRTIQSPFGNLAMAMNANLTLAQNLIEQITGDSSLITIRSRASMNRPFTVVKEMQAKAQNRLQAEVKKLEDSLADTQRRLNELQAQKKDKDQRFILTAEQRTELENYRKQEVETRQRLKEVQKELRREVVSLETRLKWINVLAMPLAVTATGILIALVKRKRTGAK